MGHIPIPRNPQKRWKRSLQDGPETWITRKGYQLKRIDDRWTLISPGGLQLAAQDDLFEVEGPPFAWANSWLPS